jgi:outer membrane immunogenic protein
VGLTSRNPESGKSPGQAVHPAGSGQEIGRKRSAFTPFKGFIMFRKSLTAAASLLALSLATGASAADLPRKSVAPVFAVPVFTWTGFYVGLNAGYGWGESKVDVTQNPNSALFGANPFGYSVKPDGFIGGAQIGYNLQFNALVVGIEADFQFSTMKKSNGFQGLPLNPAGVQAISRSDTTSKMDYFGTIRARLGFTPMDRLLIYGTGGVMFAQMKNDSTTQYNNVPFDPAFRYIGSSSSTKTGYVVGAGAEYAFTNNITAKIEYLYYDLGKQNYIGLRTGPANFSLNYDVKNTGNIVRAGVNYKF